MTTQPNHQDAVLVLHGLGVAFNGFGGMEGFFDSLDGYHALIPRYAARQSLAASVNKLDAFVRSVGLSDFRRVHVFAYILGGWVLNLYLRDHTIPNLHSIVYDRSPLQERAPALYTRYLGLPTRVFAGGIVADLARTPYPALDLPSANVGLMVETEPTPFVQRFMGQALAMGAVRWDADSFGQRYDDVCYVPLHHGEMYRRFDVFGGELVHFFEQGRFSDDAVRDKQQR